MRPVISLFFVLGVLLGGVFATVGHAQAQRIPSPDEVLGYAIGDRFPTVQEVETYMRALADASPVVSLEVYGRTSQGRPLLQVIFASEGHRQDLDGIVTRNAELTNPNTPLARAQEIARSNPAVLYFTYGIHGNESSSPSAALWTAFDLASGDSGVAGVLEGAVIVMDPVANPDGYDRYVSHQRSTELRRFNTNPGLRERNEPWPGGRPNHYLFDLNRDWAWLTQYESRVRNERFRYWNPQVHVDFHEMGAESSYFFFPAATPINPIYPEHIRTWGLRFGEGNARAMDAEGILYYTSQNFDLFYPGYGDSWPSLLGAIGMTYEQGGGGGASTQYMRRDGTVLTLRDRAYGHRTTGVATLRTAVEGRQALLEGFAGFHREVDADLSDILLVPGEDLGRLEALAELLLRHGIQLRRFTSSETLPANPHPGFAARSSFPEGTILVPMRQPRGRLAGALLRPDNPLDGSSSYDITAWALPFAYGVEAHSVTRPLPAGRGTPMTAVESRFGGELREAGRYGYLLAPSVSNTPALIRYLEEEGRVFALTEPFTLDGVAYPRGTLFFPRGRNEGVDGLLRSSGLASVVTPIATGRVEEGVDLGTNDRIALRLPRVLLLGGEGTASTGFGAHWHFLEEVLDLPFDAVNMADLGGVDLARYDVILAPPGNPSSVLGQGGMDRLSTWVRAGGTLVASGQAAHRLGASIAGVELRTALEAPSSERDARLARALSTREERADERWAERVPGTILEARLDPSHPLSWGGRAGGSDEDRLFVLSTGVGFEPSEEVESVAWFPEGLSRISGVISADNLARLDRASWIMDHRMGRGRLILFADDPIFRGFWYGTWSLYVNAILLASRGG
jgi:hypothetical protein